MMFAPKRVGEQLMEQTQPLIWFDAINIFGEQQMKEPKLIQHHVKYKEIHGVDEIKLLTQSEHKALHYRLRREGKCKTPPKELGVISQKAASRSPNKKKYNWINHHTEKAKKYNRDYHKTVELIIDFSETLAPYIELRDRLVFNRNNQNVRWVSRFQATGFKLPVVFERVESE